jgi:hypothetical protein
MKKESFAKVIRTITIPPVMALLLLLVLFAVRQDIFQNTILDLLMSILFLVLIPIAAYPLQPFIPKYKDKGREGQRNLAFIFTAAGYVGSFLYGIFAPIKKELSLILFTYFLSVLTLIFSNKVIKFRSSGHMCSVFGPLISSIYFIGWIAVIPCCILFVLICWSSLLLKRHTFYEVIGGCVCCSAAFGCSLGIVSLL